VKSTTAARFWKLFQQLPPEVQRQAFKAYELFSENPAHPSLRFEEIDARGHLWSARVSEKYRVIEGTRISVQLILEKLGDGWTLADLLSDYPQLSREQIVAALAYAAEAMGMPAAS
jgi:hypothetical protein